MEVISKDITTIKKGIICHQVNTQGVMGAGLAKQIKNKFPIAYDIYKDTCNGAPKLDSLLGSGIVIPVAEELYIANLFGQSSYGKTGTHTKYGALQDALEGAVEFAVEHNLPVYVPYNMGCGLAGGNWNTVKGVIEKIEEDYKTVITVCKYFGGL